MAFLVFSQQPDGPFDGVALVQKARTYFQVDLSFRATQLRASGALTTQVTVEQRDRAVTLELRRRASTEADWRAADEAERRGRATGMGALARRCPRVWELDESMEHPDMVMILCGILAATELGPVMPPDGATLYGVRGARERLERLSERGGAG